MNLVEPTAAPPWRRLRPSLAHSDDSVFPSRVRRRSLPSSAPQPFASQILLITSLALLPSPSRPTAPTRASPSASSATHTLCSPFPSADVVASPHLRPPPPAWSSNAVRAKLRAGAQVSHYPGDTGAASNCLLPKWRRHLLGVQPGTSRTCGHLKKCISPTMALGAAMTIDHAMPSRKPLSDPNPKSHPSPQTPAKPLTMSPMSSLGAPRTPVSLTLTRTFLSARKNISPHESFAFAATG